METRSSIEYTRKWLIFWRAYCYSLVDFRMVWLGYGITKKRAIKNMKPYLILNRSPLTWFLETLREQQNEDNKKHSK